MRATSGSALGLFVCSLFVFVALAQGILLSVVLSPAGDGQNWRVQLVAIVDPGSGVLTNITDNGYIPVDGNELGFGISALDANGGVYYFADDDTNEAVIYSSNIFNRTRLPDVNLDVSSVTNFNFDNVNGRLLLFYTNNDDHPPVLASFKNGKFQDLWKAPLNMKLASAGLDEDTQRLFMLNTTSSHAKSLTVLNLNTFKTNSLKLSDPCQKFRYSGRLLWSPTQQRTYTITEAPDANNPNVIDTYVVMIDPTSGYCQPIQLQGVPLGLVTDWALDDTMNRIYFSQTEVQGELLFAYDITTQTVLPPVIWPANIHPLNFATSPF